MRVFMQNAQTTPQNKHFSSLESKLLFQAEVLAISVVAKNLILKKMHNQSIVVMVDSQSAIKTPIKCTATLITMLNFLKSLNPLGKQNRVSIAWIPGHAGVHGN